MDKPLLIAVSDVHLSENAPVFRSSEPDWFEAMARQLRWLSDIKVKFNCPIVVAGDIFDKAVGSSRLLNFALDCFPESYAIAGNHDTPYHNKGYVDESSYGNLLRAGRIKHIDPYVKYKHNGVNISLYGFSNDVEFRSLDDFGPDSKGDLNIAVVHHYIWTGSSCPSEKLLDYHIDKLLDNLKGYDFYIFGDNHLFFIEGNVVNCGTFYRRTRNDEFYEPRIALIYMDRIETIRVPVDQDVSTMARKLAVAKHSTDFTEFFNSLREADSLTCDVEQLLEDYLRTKQVSSDVKSAIISITAKSPT